MNKPKNISPTNPVATSSKLVTINMKKEELTYTVAVQCFNCKMMDVVKILKGKLIRQTKCANCGCYELVKR